jgi:hypothetical protein
MGENNVIEEMITDENHGEKKGTLFLWLNKKHVKGECFLFVAESNVY